VQKADPYSKPETAPPRVIAISSGKGGVGKSTIAVNLGISLAKTGARVCLLDADTGLANINILLGVTPQYSLEHVLSGARTVEEVMVDAPLGLKLIPGANGISECVSLQPRQQLRLTRELARIESDFDFILIDTAAGIAQTTLDFVYSAQYTLIVITPEPTSLTDAYSLIKLLNRRRRRIHYLVVVNICANGNEAKEVFNRFSAAVKKYIGVELQFLGYVLRDESLRAAVTLQNPVALFPDTDPSCRSFVRLADSLDVATAALPVNRSFTGYWHQQYRKSNTADKSVSQSQLTATPIRNDDQEQEYLSELRSRLLLAIEKEDANEQGIQGIIREVVAASLKRFGHNPIDILAMIEQLISCVDLDDRVLRQIHDKVKPWGVVEESGVITTADICQSEDPEKLEIIQPDVADPKVHGFDSRRFGSQKELLSLLQRNHESKETLISVLERSL